MKEKSTSHSGLKPDWFHLHGCKMYLKGHTGNLVVIGSNAAQLTVHHDVPGRWKIDWEIKFGIGQKVSGNILVNDDTLAAAFGVTELLLNLPPGSRRLFDRFGASLASQGKFIRFGDFLSIPGPGTGHDGDPNISICLDEDIKKAVEKSLKAHFWKPPFVSTPSVPKG